MSRFRYYLVQDLPGCRSSAIDRARKDVAGNAIWWDTRSEAHAERLELGTDWRVREIETKDLEQHSLADMLEQYEVGG